MNLNILSFNWHEPYICLLSEIGHRFLIVEPEVTTGNYRRWDKNMRPIPSNVRLVSEEDAISQLDEGEVDIVIAHNIRDLVKINSYTLPKILVFHNRLSTEIGLGNNVINRHDYLSKVGPLMEDVKKVFISDSKRRDWSIGGDVILPGIDVDQYGGYTGDNRSILRVGNLLRERDLMMGFSAGEDIISDLPSVTLGVNPSIHGSRLSSGFDDLISNYRSQRVFLNTTIENYEDGYNLSLLEAMAVGMPVISTVNKTSPIENGVNGFISKDIKYLTQCAARLLDDQKLAKVLGDKARETVRNKFPKTKFIRLWKRSIQEAILEFLERSGNSISNKPKAYQKKSIKNTPVPKYFKNIRYDILSLVPDKATCILEVGCAAGMTGNELKKNPGVFVAGIELDPRAALEAGKVLDDVVQGNIESIDLPYEEKSFDCILFADVLEHLLDPLAVLKKTRKLLKCGGTVVASLPNVQYLELVHHLIEGNWTYQDEGILDRTHLRFFTYREIEKLFDDAGYEIFQVNETMNPQYEEAKKSLSVLNVGRLSIRDLSPEEFKRFFVFQYKISAKLKMDQLDEQGYKIYKGDHMNNSIERGKALEHDGCYQEAVKVYQEVDDSHFDYSEVLARMGNCFMRLQKLSLAESHYQQSLELSPEGYTASMGMGLLKLQLNNLDDAINIFSNITKLKPDSDKGWSGLGIAYRKIEKILDSMDALSHALKLNVNNEAAMSNLLELSYQQNSFKQIEFAMKQYLENHPKNVNILFGLAGIQYKTKRIDDSQKTLYEILEIDPGYVDAIKMLDKICAHSENIC